MPCLLALIAIFFPRVILAVLFLFTDYLGRAFETWIFPLLGFIFLPYTTLAYAFEMNINHGAISQWYYIVLIITFLMDLGAWSGGYRGKRRR